MKYRLVSLLLMVVMSCKEDDTPLVYCNYTDPKLGPERYKEEFHDLMSEKHITVEEYHIMSYSWTTETRTPYCKCMEDKINKRFGNTFIDKMKYSADSLFYVKHMNDTLKWEQCDDRAHYPGNIELDDALQLRFDSIVKYPKGYHENPDSRTYIFVDIVVNKKGDATISRFSTSTNHFINKQLEKSLEDQIRMMLPKSGWKPAMLLNHPVNFSAGTSIWIKLSMP